METYILPNLAVFGYPPHTGLGWTLSSTLEGTDLYMFYIKAIGLKADF